MKPFGRAVLLTFATLVLGGALACHSGPEQVATPTFSPVAGAFGPSFDAGIACATPDAVIRYTTDGSEPADGSPEYAGPVRITATTILKAIATKPGLRASETATATYTLDPSLRDTVTAPTFSVPPTSFGVPLSVSIDCATSGASIFYTLDGSPATTGSTPYTGAITVSDTTTINAIASHADMNDSPPASVSYTFAPVELALDDGGAEQFGGSMSTTTQVMWLNRFSPTVDQFPMKLRMVSILFAFMAEGTPMELLVYSDDDTNPANGATLLGSYPITAQHVDGSTWSHYELPSPLALSGPGDVLIAVTNKLGSGTQWFVGQDTTTFSGRSWYGYWLTVPAEPPPFPPDQSFAQWGPSWTIRGSN